MRQELRFCSSPDGTRLAYAIHGRGVPLVRTATWLTHLEFDWESPVWQHWLEGLADGRTVLRYDERGCGLSDREIEDVSLDARVADLEAVIDAAGFERVALLGISQGGPVAVAFAARYPARVSRLVLFATFARGRLMRDLSPSEREQAHLLTSLIRIGWGQGLPAFRRLFTTLFIPGATQEQMEWFDELQRVTTDPETAVRIRHARNHDDLTDEAMRVACPTLVIHSRDDALVPFAEGRLLATLIPAARFVALESRYHILLADEPAWAQFQVELRNFLGPAEMSTPVELPELSNRELEVLALVAEGRATKKWRSGYFSASGLSSATYRTSTPSCASLGRLLVPPRRHASPDRAGRCSSAANWLAVDSIGARLRASRRGILPWAREVTSWRGCQVRPYPSNVRRWTPPTGRDPRSQGDNAEARPPRVATMASQVLLVALSPTIDRGHEKLPIGGHLIPHPYGLLMVRRSCAVDCREDAHEERKDPGGDHRPCMRS